MSTETFVMRSRFEAPAEVVFRWHERDGAFQRLNPPWEPVEILERVGGLTVGARTVIRVPLLGPLGKRWVAEHTAYEPPHYFRDEQRQGPFARWVHTHTVEPDGPDACYLEDRIEYALPLGPLGRLVGGGMVREKLARTFAFRHRQLRQDLAALRAGREGAIMGQNVLVSGARGLVGSALVPFLTTAGHTVTRLSRGQPGPGEKAVAWDPDKGVSDPPSLNGFDAVIHLAGEGIANKRWSTEQKAKIRDSRVVGTRKLCEALAALERPPQTLVCASAIGIYGNRGDEVLTEASEPGTSFLADVCEEWEAAAAPAAAKGIRVVFLRFGIILSPAGGALAKMLLPFKLGAGGTLGSGKQWMSWIALDDAVGALHHALTRPDLRGPVNGVAPNPVTNYDFTKTLGKVLSRPTIFPVPGFAARLAFGEMADALLLSSQRVLPKALEAAGYAFRYPTLEGALRHLLGKETQAA